MTQPHYFRLEKLLASRGSPLQALSPSKMKICQLSIFPHTSWVLWDASWDISSFLFYTLVSFQPWKIFSFSKQPHFCCRPVQFAAVCTFSLFYFTLHYISLQPWKNCTFSLFPINPVSLQAGSVCGKPQSVSSFGGGGDHEYDGNNRQWFSDLRKFTIYNHIFTIAST